MKRNTILKKLEFHEEKITKAINDFQDFIYSIEDDELSVMGEDLCEGVLDFLHENDTCSFNDIVNFIENDYEEA